MNLTYGLMIDLERALEPLFARAVAIALHAGQTDKAGKPYIEHPQRVAEAVRNAGGGPHAIAAAWLHDVVEDTDVTLTGLGVIGFDTATLRIVDDLTRREDESHEDAVRRATSNPWSRLVKRCDVRDNMDPDRLALLDDETRARLLRKYTRALELLEG